MVGILQGLGAVAGGATPVLERGKDRQRQVNEFQALFNQREREFGHRVDSEAQRYALAERQFDQSKAHQDRSFELQEKQFQVQAQNARAARTQAEFQRRVQTFELRQKLMSEPSAIGLVEDPAVRLDLTKSWLTGLGIDPQDPMNKPLVDVMAKGSAEMIRNVSEFISGQIGQDVPPQVAFQMMQDPATLARVIEGGSKRNDLSTLQQQAQAAMDSGDMAELEAIAVEAGSLPGGAGLRTAVQAFLTRQRKAEENIREAESSEDRAKILRETKVTSDMPAEKQEELLMDRIARLQQIESSVGVRAALTNAQRLLGEVSKVTQAGVVKKAERRAEKEFTDEQPISPDVAKTMGLPPWIQAQGQLDSNEGPTLPKALLEGGKSSERVKILDEVRMQQNISEALTDLTQKITANVGEGGVAVIPGTAVSGLANTIASAFENVKALGDLAGTTLGVDLNLGTDNPSYDGALGHIQEISGISRENHTMFIQAAYINAVSNKIASGSSGSKLAEADIVRSLESLGAGQANAGALVKRLEQMLDGVKTRARRQMERTAGWAPYTPWKPISEMTLEEMQYLGQNTMYLTPEEGLALKKRWEELSYAR